MIIITISDLPQITESRPLTNPLRRSRTDSVHSADSGGHYSESSYSPESQAGAHPHPSQHTGGDSR